MATREITFPCSVRRINLAWRNGTWSIEKEVRVPSMTLPASAELPEKSKHGVTGFWYEAVDRDGRTLYRQTIEDPFAGMEVFDRDGKIRRLPRAHHDLELQVLVPDLPEVEELHLYSSTKPGVHDAEVRELPSAERIAAISLRGKKGGDYGRR